MTPARAWKLALPRAAEDTLAVRLSVLKVDEERLVREALPELVTEHAMLALIEGPEDRYGILILDATALGSLVEAATTGRIGSRPVVSREPTRTDATICADLLDAVLDAFENNLAEMDEAPNLAGYRYAAPLVDARAMTMTLAEGPYSVFRVSLDLGGGARQGEIVVAFPVAARGVGRGADIAAFQEAMAQNVMSAPAELDAALHRIRMPLAEISQLRAGDVLRVPLAALGAVGVEAVGGPAVAQARLGQQGGFRALRITRIEGAQPGDAADAPAFEEAAAPVPPVALPPGPARPGRQAGPEAADEAATSGPPQPDEAFGGEMAELPDLAPVAEGYDLPEIPGLPPLSG